MNENDDLDDLEADLVESLEAVLGDHAEDETFRLSQIQPPTSIVRAAAAAAAQVFIAFERGYRMNQEPS